MKLHTEVFMSAKFDNEMNTFLVSNSDQNFLLVQNALECIHSYSSSHCTWTNFWLDWKTLFVKLHTETIMSAKLDNDMSTSFIDHPDQKIFLFHKLQWCIHAYSSPISIWASFWLDWRTPFMKLHSETFERNIWQRYEQIFRRQPSSKFLYVTEPTRMHTLLI